MFGGKAEARSKGVKDVVGTGGFYLEGMRTASRVAEQTEGGEEIDMKGADTDD